MAFSDHARIYIASGKGGNGHVSFRREKYVAAGGPDGGDGGRGGSVIFCVDPGLNTLNSFRHKYKFTAENGEDGGKRLCHGGDGKDLILAVPEGTLILEENSRQVIADLSGENNRVTVLSGGKGGKGNKHFATPTMQVPKYAQEGKPGKALEIRLELKLIADAALIGLPNAGKSTILSRVTKAKPKIAEYPFTTLVPQLGVVEFPEGDGFVLADIPGLISGAAEGAGLGHAFLRHIERTRLLLHVVDAAPLDGQDPVAALEQINHELTEYGAGLESLPQIVVANKIDALRALPEEEKDRILQHLQEACAAKSVPLFMISAVTGEGLSELLYAVRKTLDHLPKETRLFAQEYDPDAVLQEETLPYTIEKKTGKETVFVVEGPKIEKMLGYTNLDTEKGFQFFQQFLQKEGIQEALEQEGIQEGDTVRMYGWAFTFYR